MRKKKLLLSHETLYIDDNGLSTVSISRHRHVKTGVSMFSLDLDNVPVVTCDNYFFLREILNYLPDFVRNLLSDCSQTQTFSKSDFMEV